MPGVPSRIGATGCWASPARPPASASRPNWCSLPISSSSIRTPAWPTRRGMVPKLLDIVEHHLRGTLFNIHVDPVDGLLAQGAEGYQLTWMDAKVDGWVVTPRRGKAVEINALWYNALRILEQLLKEVD